MARYRKRTKKAYTYKEKNSFKKGYWKGFFIGRKSKKKKRNNTRRKRKNYLPKKIEKGTYTSRGRINDNLIDDLNGPVVILSDDIIN